MNAGELRDCGLVALREAVAELERCHAPASSYVIAVFDGHAPVGMSVAAAVLQNELSIDDQAAARCIFAVEQSSRQSCEPFVVAIVTDEACLVDSLSSIAQPEALAELQRWLAAEAKVGHRRVVTVTEDEIHASSLDTIGELEVPEAPIDRRLLN
jgi:hypothetical protein